MTNAKQVIHIDKYANGRPDVICLITGQVSKQISPATKDKILKLHPEIEVKLFYEGDRD